MECLHFIKNSKLNLRKYVRVTNWLRCEIWKLYISIDLISSPDCLTIAARAHSYRTTIKILLIKKIFPKKPLWLWYFCQLRVGWRNERLMEMVGPWREKSSLIDICRVTQTMPLNTRGKYLQKIRKPSMLKITDSKTVLVFSSFSFA